KSTSVTSSGSDKVGPARDLALRAMAAFDILAVDHEAIGIAVSGGSDSTALLILAADWAKRSGRRIAAATVDHGLRPEARAEAESVGRLCDGLAVPHAILNWVRPDRAGHASQAEARRARHALLAEWARKSALGAIALGHTRDDRIETFLIRARQRSGWHGLAGPLPAGPSPAWPEGRGLATIRPLLAFGREELRQELCARSLVWIDDPSNCAERFERVRVRQLAARMDADAAARTLRIMNGLAHMRAAVAAEARAALALADLAPGSARIPVQQLARMSVQARLRLLEALIMAAGGGETGPRRDALDRLVSQLADSARPFGGVTLGGAWVKRKEGAVLVSQAPPRRGDAEAAGPAWERAGALLADPRLAALAV